LAKRLHRSKSAVYHRALKLKIVLAKSRRVKGEKEMIEWFDDLTLEMRFSVSKEDINPSYSPEGA
jgi:transposase